MKAVFTLPKVHKGQKEWYIWYRFDKKLIKNRYGLNKIAKLSDRAREANEWVEVLTAQLKSGWNPLVPDVVEGSELTLSQALDFSMDKKEAHLAPKTKLDYACTLRFVKASIVSLKLQYLLIGDVKMVHIKTIMEHIHKQRKWSNKSYNKNLGYLQAVLSELIQWEVIPYNPAHKIKPLKELQTSANTPPTPEEDIKIKECLSKEHPHYYVFVLVEFHTGIRPNEISAIKFNMYREVVYPEGIERSFVLPPEITKTDKERIVPINSHLWKFLEPIFEVGYPEHFYIFARHAGGKLADFMPGPVMLSRRRSTDKWLQVVKKGLEINVNQYAMKHHGANMKILAGIDLDALRELYGHASKLTTEIYAKSVKRVYRRQILDMSPDY